MKKNFSALFLTLLVILAAQSFAGISFDKLNINSDNRLVYNVTQNDSGLKPYSALFSLYLTGENEVSSENIPDILTCYPENICSLDNGKSLQIRNRYGTAVYDFEKKSLRWAARSSIIPEKSYSLSPIMVSPDGAWCIFMRKVSSSTGELIIQNVASRKYVILDKEAQYSYSEIPVKWSDDSRHFIYQKNDSLYFCSPDNMFKGLQLEEKYRRIGKGKISNIQWCRENTIVYIDTDIIYLIDGRDLNSLGLYAGYYDLGKVIGRLPEKFDPEANEFKVNRDATQLVIVKNNNFVSYYKLNAKNPSDYVTLLNYKSYTDVFNGSYKFEILWPEKSKPVIWTDYISDAGKKCSAVYLFNDSNEMIKALSVEGSTSNAAITSDGKYIAFSSGETVYIYSVNPWNKKAVVKGEKASSLCWKNNSELIVGGEQTVRLYGVDSALEECLFLSQCKAAYFESTTGSIVAAVKDYPGYFKYNDNLNTWSKTDFTLTESVKVQNDNYRVFTGKAKNCRFENGIYVRNLSGKPNTFALYKETVSKSAPKKKIALVFDLLDSADGVDSIVALCEKYNIKTTYFINGEFIRRYPAETRCIASSGAEVGSMFCTCVDLTAKDFDITEDYIRRGLARNEDEYFNVTSHELALIWHAPFYKSNKLIRDAGFLCGYSYIDFPTEIEKLDSKAGKTIESQIIPITVGLKSDIEKNIFFEKLELLINTLLDADYEIVTVSGLSSNAGGQ